MGNPEVNAVKTDRFEMEYIRFGYGSRPFVIIPGVSMKSVIPAAGIIANGFADFTKRYTVYVFDRKKNIRDRYSVMEMAEDTAEAMKQLGIRNADIFGASQGGMITQCIAAFHPALVHGVVLGSTLSRQNELSIRSFETWMELARGEDVKALNHAINTKVYSADYYRKYADLFGTMEEDGSRAEMDRFYILAKACREFDFYDYLDRIQCPVFVVGSHADCVLSGDASKEIAERLNCPLYMYDGYSHAVYDEAPDYRARMLNMLEQL